MSLILQETRRVIEQYRAGLLSYQRLVNAVDALRVNSDVLGERSDQIYATLEEINGVRIYERRQLREDEKADIEAILKEIDAAIRERQ